MKQTLAIMAFALAFAGSANAQGLNVNTNASVNANVNAGKAMQASTSVGASATGTMMREESTSTRATTRSTTSVQSQVQTRTEERATEGDDKVMATTSSGVSVQAREVRRWTEEERSAFMLEVKNHAQLQSGQDLENFAKGVIAKDENVDSVVSSDSEVEVTYRLPAKFLGVFGSEIEATTEVTFDEMAGNGPKEVTVKFPWYRIFFNLDDEAQAEVLENAVNAQIETNASASTNVYARNGKVIQLISDILKGIRAEVEAEADAEVTVE